MLGVCSMFVFTPPVSYELWHRTLNGEANFAHRTLDLFPLYLLGMTIFILPSRWPAIFFLIQR